MGRVIVTGGLIRRTRNLAMLCYAAMTAALIHRAVCGAPIVTANREFVMPGLVPGIYVFTCLNKKDVDGRDKPGHDECVECCPQNGLR